MGSAIYQRSYDHNGFGEYYVQNIETGQAVFAGSHNDCIYMIERLNNSNDSVELIINEMLNNERKWEIVKKGEWK